MASPAASEVATGLRQLQHIFTPNADRFSRFPFKHPYLLVAGMLLPQLRHATGQIRVPDTVREGDYDLVCIGSPTWWLNPCMPIRSFMQSDLAETVFAGKPIAGLFTLVGPRRSSG